MDFNDKYLPPKTEFSEKYCYNWQQIQNKIQCFASKFALNNTREDMNEVQKQGCFVFEFSYYYPHDNDNYSFKVWICKKSEKQAIHKKDYSFGCPHSHLFFEIPVVRMFDEKKIIEWQLWAHNECKRLVQINIKKRDSWLKRKQMAQDFEEESPTPNG